MTEQNLTTHSSVKVLENIKNRAMLKLKVQESIDLLPKDLEGLLRSPETKQKPSTSQVNTNLN